jgi:hypothetical protein
VTFAPTQTPAAGADPTLVLRDIHQPPAPPWWPPAIGWWLVAIVVLVAIGVLAWRVWRRRRRRRALERLFDAGIAAAATPAARIAAASAMLRRAARTRSPGAAALHGDAWLAFLDAGAREPLFGDADGALLLDGGFRREVDDASADPLVARARRRFLEWMAPR